MKLSFLSAALFAVLPTFAITATASEPAWTRATLWKAVAASKLVDPDRTLVHFSHVCTLQIESAYYPVLDLRENVKGAVSPRGYNRVLLLSPKLKLVRAIEYMQARPLFCRDNKLYLWDSIAIDNLGGEGNVWTFSQGGKTAEASEVDPNDLPGAAMP